MDVKKLLSALVAMPSVNPAFLPPRHPDAGEKQIAGYIAALARRSGLEAELQKVQPGRANVLVRLAPRTVKQRILLAPHLDTVGAFAPEQFEPRVGRGRLHGRGACDTKGSVAAMLAALLIVARKPGRPRTTEIVFCGLIDEENAQAGARALVESGLRADFAIVGEPTRLRVVTAHKGCLWLRFETRGKAAHGSCPKLGRNAVHEMARVVDLLETGYARELARRRHPLLGCPTVNVGAIRGGTQPNIVPANCVASVDRRTLPGETERSVLAELRVFLRRRGLKAGLVNERVTFCEPMETPATLPLVRRLLSVTRQRAPIGVNYFCDASALSRAGIPSVVFGPGDIAQAHTADEWISLASVERATAMLARFLQSLP